MSAQRELLFPAGSQPVETSEDAADALSPDELSARRLRVLRLFRDAWDMGTRAGLVGGLTADEVVERFVGRSNSWAPRVTELLQLGFLDRLDGKDGRAKVRRPTRSGGTGFVHVLNERGRRFLEGTQ